MAKFDDIESRLYNLKLGNPVQESIDIEYIYSGINRDNIVNIMSKITPNQINTSNLLENCCTKILKYDFTNKEKKIVSESLYRILPYVPKIKKYKDLITEVSNRIENNLIDKNIKTFIECDRIINNQEKLEEYSNFSSIFESYYAHNDIERVVIESCDIINSYKMIPELKLNVALENTIYNMDKTKQKYNKKELVNLIYEYFCINANPEICKNIIKESSIELSDIDIKSIIEGNTGNNIDQKFKELIRSGKANKSTTESLIKKIYIENDKNIVEDLPTLLRWLRIGAILGIAAYNLPVGFILLLADHIISIRVNRSQIEKSIKIYKKEKGKIEDKKYSVSNPNTIKKYNELDKEYEKSIEKLETYRDSLYSDKENDDRLMNEYCDDIIKAKSYILTLSKTITNYCKNNDIKNLITEYISDISDIEESTILFESLDNSKLIAKNIINIKDISQYLDKPKIAGSLTSDISKFNKGTDANANELEFDDSVEEMVYFNGIYNALSENTFTAKAKLLAINAKKKVEGLSDKEKMISKEIDDTFNRVKDKLDEQTTNKNREAVVRGTILPSMSSLIKLVLGSYVVGTIVTPLLGVIGFVGMIALSKRSTDEERRYILDEIDVQLDVVDKKISMAENKNDMKSYEQLLRIQKKLKQEKQRIIYKKGARNIYHSPTKD